MMDKNKITISGMVDKVVFSHEIHGTFYYQATVTVKRKSNVSDFFTVIARDDIWGAKNYDGEEVIAQGVIRSRKVNGYNTVYIEAERIDVSEEPSNENLNMVEITGTVCNSSIKVKRTPLTGRNILNLYIAVSRKSNRSDYIVCCLWGKKAKEFEKKLTQGSKIEVSGRLTNRELYREGQFVTLCEISANEVEVINE